MKQGFFITGTDTGVGKTWFTVLLMRYLQAQGHHVNGMKPIASGSEQQGPRLVNEDAEAILHACSGSLDYDTVNPLAYAPPIAPHIAAQQAGRPIDLDQILAAYTHLTADSDVLVVEGVGGWRVPVNAEQSLVALVRRLQLPVILVIGLRLGCINHALLTAESIRNDGVPLFGWAISELEKDYLYKAETLATIENAVGCPMLGEVPHSESDCLQDAVLNITSAGQRLLQL